ALAGKRRLAAAVEEIRHVGVLLGLGAMELRQAALGEDLGDGEDALRWIGNVHRGEVDLVLGHGNEVEVTRPRLSRETGEVRLHQCPGELAGAVGPEVEEEDAVAVPYRARGPATWCDDIRRHQLIPAGLL